MLRSLDLSDGPSNAIIASLSSPESVSSSSKSYMNSSTFPTAPTEVSLLTSPNNLRSFLDPNTAAAMMFSNYIAAGAKSQLEQIRAAELVRQEQVALLQARLKSVTPYPTTSAAPFISASETLYNPYLLPSRYDLTPRRRTVTRDSTGPLKAWLSEHEKHPYPTKGEKIMLAIFSKMTLIQVNTWFANARRRLKKENKMTWKPPYNREEIERCEDDESSHSRQKTKLAEKEEKPKIWSLADTAAKKTDNSVDSVEPSLPSRTDPLASHFKVTESPSEF